MGYLSNVALAMSKQAKADLYLRLLSKNTSNDLREEVESLFKNADQHFDDPDTGAEAWYWSGLKWYTCDPKYYPDIDFLDNLMAEMDEREFLFVRAGEEFDDNDIHGKWHENPFAITFRREIVFGS